MPNPLIFEPCMFWEDSKSVLEEKIFDRGFEIEDFSQSLPLESLLVQGTQLYDYGNDLKDPLFDDVLVEPNVEHWFEMLPPKLPQLQDVQVCVVVVPEQVLKLPKEGKDDLGHVVDPLDFVFKQASFEHSVVTFQHAKGQAAYPYPDPYYRSIFAPYDAQPYPAQSYTAQPMVHLQLMGIQQAGVPLPSDAVEEPVFVNAKQYHGILRRRQSRAKAELEKKMAKSRKPYLHESRHLHALKRARGCGGRFVNSKKNENQQQEEASGDKAQADTNVNSDQNNLAPSESSS
ncbi:hypothetical protein RHMOL_Rhmol02G0202100 [Rhododendron molle]|uniref:Uncharacterized protein n=1 Tax=Rhododendron molle TaxID=49168 RepID=A0ACC0PUL1_RHOML|nr:hypothetical protein RHMOL_Rhmol02G0202100 [Rhododendron molle]